MSAPDMEATRAMVKQLDLGDSHIAITTNSPDAQFWFDAGLRFTYAFIHEFAIRCFKFALVADAKCVMAHWGVAFANGINYNSADFMIDEKEAFEHAQQARELSDSGECSAMERDLAHAIALRYRFPLPASPKERHAALHDLNLAFASAMAKVYHQYPDDGDVAAVYVESLMDVKPWQLWEPGASGEYDPRTLEVQSTLEKALAQHPKHPALLHLYLHCMELSPTPQAALPAANLLRTLVPHAGHLLHMPSHIDMWLGHYEAAIKANEMAVIADDKFVEVTGSHRDFYLGYRMHDQHLLVWAALFDGQYTKAMKAARAMQHACTRHVVELFPDAFEAYTTMPWHVMVRFGKWDEVLAEPLPDDPAFWVAQLATARYARGIAYAVLGKVEEAEAEQAKLHEVLQVPALATRFLHNNLMIGCGNGTPGIMDVAKAMLEGETQYRKGNYEAAFAALRTSVELDDALNYDEPWGWMQPTRHALAALLLEQHHVEEAEQVYRKDLAKNPDNLWSLVGLVKCARERGGTAGEVDELRRKLDVVAARAEVKVKVSCMCARAGGL